MIRVDMHSGEFAIGNNAWPEVACLIYDVLLCTIVMLIFVHRHHHYQAMSPHRQQCHRVIIG